MFTQTVRKVGSSFVVAVPQSEIDRLDLSEGDYVSVELSKLHLKPVLDPELEKVLDRDLPHPETMLNYLKDR